MSVFNSMKAFFHFIRSFAVLLSEDSTVQRFISIFCCSQWSVSCLHHQTGIAAELSTVQWMELHALELRML